MKRKIAPYYGSTLLICLVLSLLISLNYCAAKLTSHFGLRFDMTSNQLYALSDETVDLLNGLKKEIHIRVFSSEAEFLPLVSEVLEQYRLKGNGAVSVEYIDPYTHPELTDSYIQRGYQLELGSIAVEGEQYTRILQLEDMFEMDSSGKAVQGIKCEQQISSAILYAAGTDSLSVKFTSGHNEYVSDSLKGLFEQNNYEIGYISLAMEEIKEDTNLLVIASPTTDFSEEETAALDAYMAENGRLLVFTGASSAETPNFETFLNEWGIRTTDIIVAEGRQYTDSNPLSIVPVYTAHSINQYFAGNQIYLVMPSCNALDSLYISQGGIRTQKVLYSTDRSYDFQNKDGEKGPFTLAMTAEKVRDSEKARLVVIGSRGLYSDSLMTADNYGNSKFMTQVINWCTETDSVISIPSKNISQSHITITIGQVIAQAIFFVLILPSGMLLAGFFIYRRRHHS